MGSVVAYRCPGCGFATDQLSIGWGKAGRARFWGGLALCVACKDIVVVNLADSRTDRRDQKCTKCNGPLKLIEGTADSIPCPQCAKPFRAAIVGSWS